MAIIYLTSVHARSARTDDSFEKLLGKVTSGLSVAKNGVARFLDGYDNDGILTVVIVIIALVVFLPLVFLPFAGLLGGASPLALFQNQGRRRRDVNVDQMWTYANDAVTFLEDALKKYQ